MSLLDSMLLEGYRDPREVWIALRSDGVKGSGTIDDPYDGGTRFGPAIPAGLTCALREFVVGTQFAHGLQVGASVTITGCTGPGADWFNITATVQEVVSPLHFTLLASNPSNPTALPPAPPDVPYSPGVIYADYTVTAGNQNYSVPTPAHIYWPVAKVTTTSEPHGLPSFGAVDVGGINSPDDTRFAGSHVALGPDSTGQSFRCRLTFLPGADVTTAISCAVTRHIHRFDDVMRSVPPNSIIHLGSGTFETRGSAPPYISNPFNFLQVHVGFVVQSGQRLLGCGVDASVIKLVLPVDEFNQTTAIGHYSSPVADYAEVAGLTVDCNAPGHVAPYGTFPAPVTCGAVALGGRYIRIRRVRAINFCVQGRAECFAIGVGQGGAGNPAPTFNVIEDCIVEKPGENNTHETTLLANIGDAYGNGRSPIVRHNYTDCRYASNGASSELLWIDRIEYTESDTEAVVTTRRPHHRTANNNVLLANVRQRIYDSSNPPNQIGETTTVFSGSFPITAVLADNQFKIRKPDGAPPSSTLSYESPYDSIRAAVGVDFHGPAALSGTGCVTEGNSVFDCVNCFYADTGSSRDVVVRDNYCSNAGWGMFMNFPPAGFDTFQGASAIVPENAPEDPGFNHGVFTTIQPHGLSVNDTVTVREAGSSGPDANNPYHGAGLVVKAIRSATQFVYRLDAGLPVDNCAGRPVFRSAVAIASNGLNYTSADLKATATTGANHNLEAGDFVTISGASPATFNGFVGPITVISATQFSFLRDLGVSNLSGTGGDLDRHVAAGIVRNGSVATVTTASPHGYYLGQTIRVREGFINGDKINPYNGILTVKPLTDKTFSYEMKPGPEPDSTLSKSPTGLAEYAAHWDVRYFVLESNIYDLYATDNNTMLLPRGASMFGLFQEDIPPYLFPVFIYRGNVIRHIDEKLPLGTPQPSYGIFATTVGGGMVEQNVIDVSAVHPLTLTLSRKLDYLENRTSGGTPIHGANLNPDQSIERLDDLETRIADALVIAVL